MVVSITDLNMHTQKNDYTIIAYFYSKMTILLAVATRVEIVVEQIDGIVLVTEALLMLGVGVEILVGG